jgi:hypothetical protein
LKTERICLVTTGLLLGLVASGCQERNPAYIQAQADAAVGAETQPDAVEVATVPPDTARSHADVPRDNAILPDVGGVDDGPQLANDVGDFLDVSAADDARDALRDTRDARRSDEPGPDSALGPDAPVDAIIDSVDLARDVPTLPDVGPDVFLGVDVTVTVDLPPLCNELDKRSCSSPGNPLVGACHVGSQTCTGGTWGPCVGETLPAATDQCKGLDDNCNGITDEGCVEGCVVVAPSGDDTTADGTPGNPFATIEAAAVLANAQDGGPPRRVCVAGGATCNDNNAYAMDAPLIMASGGSVQGNYALADSALSYCANTQPPTTALAFTASEQGVVFDQSVVLHTELNGFTIQRFSPASGSTAAGPISAVLVKGGVNITLSGIFVTDAPSADATYGVDVESGGQVTIVGSAIGGGQGRSAAIGVYVNGGLVNLRNNCDTTANGVCNSPCASGSAVLGMRGRSGAAVANGADDSSAVYVTKASPAKSSIVANTLCGGAGAPSDSANGANLATLRCESGACATIVGNSIGSGSGRQTIAVNLLGGASLVDSNLIVAACGIDASTGVVLDDAPARLQNNRIVASQCPASATGTSYGVHILLGTSPGEPDLSSNDIEPMGAAADCQSFGVAIDKSTGNAEVKGILRNNIVSAGNCHKRVAVAELSSSSVRIVENNDLYPGPISTATDSPVLYRRGNTDGLTVADVNALAGAAKNISAEPRFVSYPTDLHLTSKSPCIDRGTSEGAPATDGDGNPRPVGAGFDIGAYELSGQ